MKITKKGGIFVALLCLCLIAVWALFLRSESPSGGRNIVPVTELPDCFRTDVSAIREITQCDVFPVFEVKELWFDQSDSSHCFPHLECSFKKELTEQQFSALVDMCDSVYWDSDKDGTLCFSRGWSTKDQMEVPAGMEEDVFVSIEKLCKTGFTLSFMKNVKGDRIEDDFLSKLTDYTFPPFSVVSYMNDGDEMRATLRFHHPVDKHTVEALSYDSDEIKIDTVINGQCFFFTMLANELIADLSISPK